MAFIRSKMIRKNGPYYYLVESYRDDNGKPRQRHIAYVGKDKGKAEEAKDHYNSHGEVPKWVEEIGKPGDEDKGPKVEVPKKPREEEILDELEKLKADARSRGYMTEDESYREERLNDELIGLRLKDKKPKNEVPKEEFDDLPPLKDGEKYYVVSIDEKYGSIQHISHSGDSGTAEKSKIAFDVWLRKVGDDDRMKVKIIPAKNMDDARAKLKNKGKDDYMVTGETYQNRKALRSLGLKFDYNEKAYRGKLSPEQIKTIKNMGGLEVEKSKPFSEEEQQVSKEVKYSTKAERKLKRAEKLRDEAQEDWEKAHEIADRIPPGQPILKGHHSQKRHEKDLDRIDKKMESSIEKNQEAEKLERQAKTLKNRGKYKKGSIEESRNNTREKVREKLKKGDRVNDSVFGSGTVLKVNKKSAKIKFDSGYTQNHDLWHLRHIAGER